MEDTSQEFVEHIGINSFLAIDIPNNDSNDISLSSEINMIKEERTDSLSLDYLEKDPLALEEESILPHQIQNQQVDFGNEILHEKIDIKEETSNTDGISNQYQVEEVIQQNHKQNKQMEQIDKLKIDEMKFLEEMLHPGNKKNLCYLCNKTFQTKHTLKRHIINVHQKSKKVMELRCDLCNKLFILNG